MPAQLKADIQSCVDCDRVYSPDADIKRQLIGKVIVAKLSVTVLLTTGYNSVLPFHIFVCCAAVYLSVQIVALSVKPCSFSLVISTVTDDSCVHMRAHFQHCSGLTSLTCTFMWGHSVLELE